MQAYEAILFDFDGVLVDSEPVHFECWQQVLLPFGIVLDWNTYSERWIGMPDRSMLASLAEEAHGRFDVDRLWAEYPRKKDLFRSRMQGGGVISPETTSLIERLHGTFKLAVVTSSQRTEVEPVLANDGVLPKLDTVIYGGDVQRLKPNPDPYLLACERLGTRRALVVEDSQPGVQAGRAANLDVLQIPRQQEMPARVLAYLGLAASTQVL